MNKYILSVCVLFAFLGGCKKDTGLDSRELLVYMQGDIGDANNAVTASLTLTPVSVWGNTVFQFRAWATRQMAASATVEVAADSTALASFNKLSGKQCKLLPSGTYSIDGAQRTIALDSVRSDAITVTVTKPSVLTDTNGYVLPVTIRKVTSQDHGVAVSGTRATAYLYIPYAFTNIDTTGLQVAGTLVTPRTGWNVTVSNTTSGALGPAMVDGNNATAWRSSNSSTAAKYVIVNLKSAQSIKGFRLVPDYVTTTENPTQIRVSTSSDSTTWTVQGIWKGALPATGSSAAAPDLKWIGFLAPVQTQYFRFDILAWGSGSRTGIGELDVVQ
ncbi:MAG: discoidin domain-containing protein [Bacteroidetes bacterium]|nr:discoidin domain-containing protein [Bacteroidota bacterium]